MKNFIPYLIKYLLLIPLIWACFALLTHAFPGAEYYAKITSFAPGLLLEILPPGDRTDMGPFPIISVCIGTMLLIGLLMDWLKVNRYL